VQEYERRGPEALDERAEAGRVGEREEEVAVAEAGVDLDRERTAGRRRVGLERVVQQALEQRAFLEAGGARVGARAAASVSGGTAATSRPER